MSRDGTVCRFFDNKGLRGSIQLSVAIGRSVDASVRVDHIGRPVLATQAGGRSCGAWPGVPATLRFPGQWFQSGEPDQRSLRGSDLPANGLHQNWMRDYDPSLGRYLQADPLGLVDGASVYGYARQSPNVYADPTGQCPAARST